MPPVPRIVAVNLGSHTLGLAGFHSQPNGGLTLAGYRLREIPADLSATDRNLQITEALTAMMRELGIKRGPADYAVPGQSVFARFVKLPSVEQDKSNASLPSRRSRMFHSRSRKWSGITN